LAIPAAAGVIASLVIFDLHITQMGAEVKPLLILVITFVLAFLMVSTIKYRSFKDMKFRRGDHFTYLVWGILALMLIVAWPQAMFFVTFAGYALSGPVVRLWTIMAKNTGKQTAKPDAPLLDTRE
jgi:CDP-diacylglycerol--serine O-phosphatidyltransferase